MSARWVAGGVRASCSCGAAWAGLGAGAWHRPGAHARRSRRWHARRTNAPSGPA